MKTATNTSLAALIVLGLGYALPAQAQQLAQDAAVAAVGAAAVAQVAAQGSAVNAKAHELVETQANLPKAMTDTKSSVAMAEPSGSIVPSKYEAPVSAASSKTEVSASPVPSKFEAPALDIAKEKGDREKDSREGLSSPKTPESVKKAVKRLNTATDDVTLEDLNSAREAVAKLDILIDIEKRLSDLETIRQEREGKSLAGAIPSSALGFPASMPVSSSAPAPVSHMDSPVSAPMPVMSMPADVDVTRIVGVTGRYTAMIKTGDGKSISVRPGDKLSDGSVVKEISSRSVTLMRGKQTRTVDVKDVSVVFNGR